MKLLVQLRSAARYEWARNRAEMYAFLVAPGFYTVVLVLFGALLGPWPQTLERVAAAIVWSGATITLSVCGAGMFRSALDEGSLQRWAASGRLLSAWILGVVWVWLWLYGLPLLICSALALMSYNGSYADSARILAGLAIALPGLLGLGALASAVGYGRGALLQPLLILPLILPLMLFGVEAANTPGALLWLGALSTAQFLVGVVASSWALREQLV